VAQPSLSSTRARASEPWAALSRYEEGRGASEVSPKIDNDNDPYDKETDYDLDNVTQPDHLDSNLHDPFSPWTAPPPPRALTPQPTTPTSLRKRRQQWQAFGVDPKTGEQKWSNVNSGIAAEINAQALTGGCREENLNYAAAVAPIAFVGAKGIRAEELATLTSRPKTEAQARLEQDWDKMFAKPRHPNDKRGVGYVSPPLEPTTASPPITVAAVSTLDASPPILHASFSADSQRPSASFGAASRDSRQDSRGHWILLCSPSRSPNCVLTPSPRSLALSLSLLFFWWALLNLLTRGGSFDVCFQPVTVNV